MAGRLQSFDNAAVTSASEPDLYIASTAYNARGQTKAGFAQALRKNAQHVRGLKRSVVSIYV
jgi:hypothetical protein